MYGPGGTGERGAGRKQAATAATEEVGSRLGFHRSDTGSGPGWLRATATTNKNRGPGCLV